MMKKQLRTLLLASISFCLLITQLNAQDFYLAPNSTLYMGANSAMTVKGNATFGDNSVLDMTAASPTTTIFSLEGNATFGLNFSHSSTFGTGAFAFTGTTPQTATIPSNQISNPKFYVFRMNNPSGLTFIGSNSRIPVFGQLNLVSGNITTGSNYIDLTNGGAGSDIVRTSGHVIGNLQNSVRNSLPRIFAVGTATDYSPITITIPDNSTGGMQVSTTATVHPQAASNFSSPKIVKRFWDIQNIHGSTYNLTATYLPADNDVTATPANYKAAFYGGAWGPLVSPTGTPTNTSATFNGLTSSGAFQIGERDFSALNVTAILEGLHIGNGVMRPALLNSGVIGATATQADSVTVELRNTTLPYAVAFSQKVVLNTNGSAAASFDAVGNYYVVIKHRNSIETWSAAPVTLNGSTTYNFTDAANKAFGDNLKDLGSGRFGIYSGDVNQDGTIDLGDYPALDSDNNNFVSGYIKTDLNGDGSSDVGDYLVLDFGNNNFVGVIKPSGANRIAYGNLKALSKKNINRK